jgi:hypothetical protein
LGQRKNDPHQKLESLERWSARATLLILAGIVADIVLLFWFPHDRMERLGATIANVLIAAGLLVEYVVILRAIVATGDANRESDERVAAAEARAAEAERETQRLRAQFAWRRLSPDQMVKIAVKLRPTRGSIGISYVHSDPECQYFAFQFLEASKAAGWAVGMLGGIYGELRFGIIVPDAGPEDELTALVMDAFSDVGIGFNIAPIPSWTTAVGSGDGSSSGENSAHMFIGPRQPTVG